MIDGSDYFTENVQVKENKTKTRNIHHRHSGRITSVILAESVAALEKAETTLRHKHLAVLPTAISQISHYVIIENNHESQSCEKKTMLPKK